MIGDLYMLSTSDNPVEKRIIQSFKKLDAPPVLWLVIPCYNEEKVLPFTIPRLLEELEAAIGNNLASSESRILFVDDGSSDSTWSIIAEKAEKDTRLLGMSLSRNCGHQNALMAGLMEANGHCDVTISADCDGQDDFGVIRDMLEAYANGYEIVYGVRSSRNMDSAFKRMTAEGFYRFMSWMGADIVFNHADYRLIGSAALAGISQFEEVNLFLRGLVPLVGFESTIVTYERQSRKQGNSHYPLKKMISLALDGITSLSVKPMHIITGSGILFFVIGLLLSVWAIVTALTGNAVAGWASTVCIISIIGGIQLLALGIIGEYIGKIYLETKRRPRWIVKTRTFD